MSAIPSAAPAEWTAAVHPADETIDRVSPGPGLAKSPVMILAILVAYATCAAIFTPRLLSLFYEATTWLAQAVLVVFILQIQVFWLYTLLLSGTGTVFIHRVVASAGASSTSKRVA